MLRIAFANRKGGVGKTSSCHHLAGAFARLGRRVLLVDLDPQASLTQGLLGPQAAAAVDPARSAAAAFDGGGDPQACVRVLRFAGGRGLAPVGFDLLPGHPLLASVNHPDPERFGEAQLALRDFLRGMRADYNVVLIDCPPNLQLLTRAAVAAASGVVAPLQPEDYGAQGLAAVAAEVERVRLAGLSPGVELLGFLLTMVQRNALHGAYADAIRQQHPGRVFAAEVPRAVAFAEAVTARQPIGVLKPRSAGAKAIDAVAAEVLARSGAAGGRAAA